MSFDLLAPHYRWMELVLAGGKLQQCRTFFLDQIPIPRSILLVGEGHGRSLVECCRRFPHAQAICVDSSERMLRMAARALREREIKADQVEFVQADILDWTPPSRAFDLIVTNFFLDCFRPDQLAEIVGRLTAAAAVGANWLLADFQLPPRGAKRCRAQLILWSMYLFFRAATRLPARRLEVPDAFLQAAGFALHQRVETEWDLLHSDWWKLELP